MVNKLDLKKMGKFEYVNENCWLSRNSGYSPVERCQYCELKFHNCLFFPYLIISLVLALFLFTVSFLIEGEISRIIIISIFTLIIVYGYFFNKSTNKIIKVNFAERKTKKDLEELTERLEEKVDEQTEALRKSYEKLKVLDDAKSAFIAIASHQLRTPLTTTKGYISMVLENDYGELPKKIREPLINVYQSNERLISLVNNLLNISKINAGKMELNFEKIYLQDLIKSTIDELENDARKKNITLIFEKPLKKEYQVLVDKESIRQVILNIVDNAIKYTNSGKITVSLKKNGYNYRIKIQDTGEGLTKEEITEIFKSFFRGKRSRKTIGSGLGLHIAKKFVKMHKGEVWVESQGKGKGSTFYIDLPIRH